MARATRVRIWTVAAACLGALACVTTSASSVSDVAGCYQIRSDAGSRALGLPWGFVLEDAPLERPSMSDGRVARTAVDATRRATGPFTFWRLTAGDSVMVGEAGGGGFALTFAREGQNLVGVGRAVGDAVAPGEDPSRRGPHPVRAYKVVCGG